jgi:hypothetical protein
VPQIDEHTYLFVTAEQVLGCGVKLETDKNFEQQYTHDPQLPYVLFNVLRKIQVR